MYLSPCSVKHHIPSAAPYSQCLGRVQLMVTGSGQAKSKVHHILFKLSDFQEESWTTAFFPRTSWHVFHIITEQFSEIPYTSCVILVLKSTVGMFCMDFCAGWKSCAPKLKVCQVIMKIMKAWSICCSTCVDVLAIMPETLRSKSKQSLTKLSQCPKFLKL